METRERPTAAYLKELAWAGLLLNAFAAGVGVFVGIHMDDVVAGLVVFLGGCALVTLLLGLLVAGTLAWDATAGALERRGARAGRQTRPDSDDQSGGLDP